MFRAALTVVLLVMPLTQAARLGAQGEEPKQPQEVERIIGEILQLRGEAEALLESLPPELREEVERRWLELQAAEVQPEPVAGAAAPDPAPKPAPEPELQLEPGPESEPVVPSEVKPEPEPEPEPEPARECDSLGPLDTNGDGVISAGDRNWRYLRLRTEQGGRSASLGDLESLYDAGVREIDVNLGFYKLADGLAGDITVDDRIRLALIGKRKSTRQSTILFIQASRLARAGNLQLVDASGALLAGDQPLAPGMALLTAEGKRLPILCP